jgi:hypothetical protein
LLLCPTSEFSWRLLQLPGSTGNKLQSNDCTTRIRLNEEAPLTSHSMSRPSHGDDWDDRKKKNVMPVKNWLQRWWFPDLPEPRKASRESFPCLGAHFWTGCVPVKHEVRDISLTGLYVVTDERWSPGTQVRMTLTDSEESVVKNSITAVTSVVRWGNDGVGLTFVMRNEKQLQRGLTPAIGGIAMKDLNRFLVLARSGKRDRESREAHPMVSPSDRGEAIHSDANPGLHDLFIGPVNSSLLIGSLKDLPRPVSIAGSPILMNSHIKSHRRCPALYPQHL